MAQRMEALRRPVTKAEEFVFSAPAPAPAARPIAKPELPADDFMVDNSALQSILTNVGITVCAL